MTVLFEIVGGGVVVLLAVLAWIAWRHRRDPSVGKFPTAFDD